MKNKTVTILLAEDDYDDRYLISEALDESGVETQLFIVENGEDLLDYLKGRGNKFPIGGTGAGITATLWHRDPMIGVVVTISMIIAMMVASTMGTLIPAFFKLIKVDPAIASGPFVTTVNDITGILIYLGTATLFLKFYLHA